MLLTGEGEGGEGVPSRRVWGVCWRGAGGRSGEGCGKDSQKKVGSREEGAEEVHCVLFGCQF